MLIKQSAHFLNITASKILHSKCCKWRPDFWVTLIIFIVFHQRPLLSYHHRGIPQNDLQFCPPLSPIQIVPRVRLCWFSFYVLTIVHRRRDYTKEKAKVVAAVWGQYLLLCLPHCMAILHQDDIKKRMNSSCSSNRPGAIYWSLCGKELNQFRSLKATTFVFYFV